MPKATLTFSLPDEREDFDLACNAGKLHSALYELSTAIRSKVKYSEEETTTWDEVKEMFWNTLKEAGAEI